MIKKTTVNGNMTRILRAKRQSAGEGLGGPATPRWTSLTLDLLEPPKV